MKVMKLNHCNSCKKVRAEMLDITNKWEDCACICVKCEMIRKNDK